MPCLAPHRGIGGRDAADLFRPVVHGDQDIGGGQRDPGFRFLGAVLIHEGGLVAIDQFLQGARLQASGGHFLADRHAHVMAARGASGVDLADGFAPPLETDEAERLLAHHFLHARQLVVQRVERHQGAALGGGGKPAGNPAILVDAAHALVDLVPGSLGQGSGLV